MNKPGRSVPTRVRLIVAILSVALIGFTLAGSIAFAMQRDRIVHSIDERLNDQVSALSGAHDPQNVEVLVTPPPPPVTRPEAVTFDTVNDALYDAVARLAPGTNAAAFAILDGVPTYRASEVPSLGLAEDDSIVETIVSEVLAANAPVLGTARTTQGDARYIAIPVQAPGSPEVGIYVHVINLSAELAPLNASITIYGFTVGACLIVMAVVTWFILARLLPPAPAAATGVAFAAPTAPEATAAPVVPPAPTVPTPPAFDAPPPFAPPSSQPHLRTAPTPGAPPSTSDLFDQVEGSLKAQRQLLDDVRHELKTPITIVRGYLEMMNVSDPFDVQAAREIGISELDRMTRLVEDIDTLATVEGDEYTMGSVDIGRLTERVGDLISVIPGHTWQVTRVADGIIRGNSDRVLQAWLALCDNAAKYTPAGSVIEIGSARTQDSMMLRVRDHGPGIPPAARHRIFRRFDRGAGKREVGGSGLGLAIVDVIARAHGGSCSVSETPGGGATFTIHVPLRLGGGTTLPAPVRAGDVVQQREEQE